MNPKMNVTNTKMWFISYVRKALEELANLRTKRSEKENWIRMESHNIVGKRHRLEMKQAMEDEKKWCEEIYYDQMRFITEMFYIFENYIDLLLKNSKDKMERASFLNLARIIYIKSQDVQSEICRQNYPPKTFEQKEILKALFSQFYTTEKTVSKYFTKSELYYKPARNIPKVNYKL